VTASPRAALHRDLIIKLSAQHKLPAVYYERNFVAGGGLISYGPDFKRDIGYPNRLRSGE
jgi:putative tryptophan/tyrosine transport system substrate-binding protein